MKRSSALLFTLVSTTAALTVSRPALAATEIPFTIVNSEVNWVGSPANVTSRTLSGSGQFTFNNVIQNGPVTLSDLASFVADLTYTVNFTGGGSATGNYHFGTSDVTSLSSAFSNYFPTSFFFDTSPVSPTSGNLTVPLSLSINAPVVPSDNDGLSFFAYPNGVKTLTATGGLEANVTGGPGAVPEASTWVMMLLGLGLVGAYLRRRPRAAIQTSPARVTFKVS